MNELPEYIEFEKKQKAHRRIWNYAMGLLAVASLAGIVVAILYAH